MPALTTSQLIVTAPPDWGLVGSVVMSTTRRSGAETAVVCAALLVSPVFVGLCSTIWAALSVVTVKRNSPRPLAPVGQITVVLRAREPMLGIAPAVAAS